MKKTIVFFSFMLIGLLVVSLTSVPLEAAIPASERNSLIALYYATNGYSWRDNSGWRTPPLHTDGFAMPGTENNWYGITVNSVSGDHVSEIDLVSNQLSGGIPGELGNLSYLYILSLCLNQLSGSIPAELGNLNNLEVLELHSNQLSGSIPAELGNLNNLGVLTLGDNHLTGSIPARLGDLSNLGSLLLSDNQLSGSIPKKLGELKNLASLDLSLNQLSGSIPAELGNLNNLNYLNLDHNHLSGSIPAELGNLNNLFSLTLNHNHLSGSIPTELGNLSNLFVFFLNSNQLSSSIPSSLANLTNLHIFFTNIGYNGLYTNDDTLRTFLNSKDPDWEKTQTIAPANVSAAAISTSSIRVAWTPITYTGDTGGYKVYYSMIPGGPLTYSGMTADKSVSSYDVTDLCPGTIYYLLVKTQTNPHLHNENTIVSEYSEEVSAVTGFLEEKDPPFGFFDTPIDGSIVAGSIPVSGWALDDTGIDSVKIYRAQGNSLIYIGDATMVEGARPDVAQLYPGYPNNTRAGWGYMMLTNFLPNSGNGTFIIHAIATDLVGKITNLGNKTIHCDNANAVKPFGAIDTPTQGGTASGSNFVNWGWALTPQPNIIPTDGSTINVFVDGVNLGHPFYNIYRSDIAFLFLGYANSDGAIGYFYLDTMSYTNGVHTIHWTATDSGGNADGIGSRYFSIQNSGGRQQKEKAIGYWSFDTGEKIYHAIPHITITDIPKNDSNPIGFITGFKQNSKTEEIYPNDKGFITIEIKEVTQIQIDLIDRYYEDTTPKSKSSIFFTGYLLVDNRLKTLPVGSTLDTQRGIFYWLPGPGFIGEYHLVFIEKEKDGMMSRKDIIINIVPKFSYIGDTR